MGTTRRSRSWRRKTTPTKDSYRCAGPQPPRGSAICKPARRTSHRRLRLGRTIQQSVLSLAIIQNALVTMRFQQRSRSRTWPAVLGKHGIAIAFRVLTGMSHNTAANLEDTDFATVASSSSVVAMVQPSQASPRDHLTATDRSGSTSRGFFTQPEMGAIVMVIRDVIGEESLQVSLVQRNDLVEQFAAAASHPVLGDSVLPGTLNRGTYA